MSPSNRGNGLTLTIIMIAIATMVGCGGRHSGPQRYHVSGEVTLDGIPLDAGDIHIVSAEDGKGIDSGTITNGMYQLQATPGSKLVKIVASRIVPGKENPGIPGTPVYEDIVPTKYIEQTTLQIEIKASDDNTINFELHSL